MPRYHAAVHTAHCIPDPRHTLPINVINVAQSDVLGRKCSKNIVFPRAKSTRSPTPCSRRVEVFMGPLKASVVTG